MSFEDQDKLIQAENRLIKMVCTTLDKMIRNASERLAQEKRKVSKYKSEDQDEFLAYEGLASAIKNKNDLFKLKKKLCFCPYSFHIKVRFDDGHIADFLLSKCESLDRLIEIDQYENECYLVPFKQDEKWPIVSALFQCCQTKNGDKVMYDAPGGKLSFVPSQIYKIDIEKRNSLNVSRLYP